MREWTSWPTCSTSQSSRSGGRCPTSWLNKRPDGGAGNGSLYIDADLLGLAKLLCSMRSDFTYPGDQGATIRRRERPPCIIATPQAKDPDWIPRVAAEGWLIVTRDRHIQQRLGEINAVRDHNAKMINLAGEDARDPWGQLEVFMTRWREIEPLVDIPGPFIYIVSRTGQLRPINLSR